MARGAPRLTQGLSVSSWSVASVAAAPATELSVVTEMALTNQKYLQEQTATVIIGVNRPGKREDCVKRDLRKAGEKSRENANNREQ